MRYTFGHTENAAERLRDIAGFFNPLAAEFIRSHLKKSVDSAADLGCGPGYTTYMLANAIKAKQVTGIDISDYFIGLAKNNFPEMNFIIKDLTRWNSNARFDILYCRFLLSHLVNIKLILANWIDHLTMGGMLVIDELEDIHTEMPVFRRYLDMNDRLIKSQEAELYVGKQLSATIEKFNVLVNQSDLIPVQDSQAAGWFFPNTVGIWNEEKLVMDTLSAIERKSISDELLAIYESKSNKTNITWKMKRIILTN